MSDYTYESSLSDAHLLRQAIAGDVAAFEVLFSRHALSVAEWARKTLCSGDQEAADELIHLAFLNTHKNLRFIDNPAMSFEELVQEAAIDINMRRHHKVSVRLHKFLFEIGNEWRHAAALKVIDPKEIDRRMSEMDRIKSTKGFKSGLDRLFKMAGGMSVASIARSENVAPATVRKSIKTVSEALQKFLGPL